MANGGNVFHTQDLWPPTAAPLTVTLPNPSFKSPVRLRRLWNALRGPAAVVVVGAVVEVVGALVALSGNRGCVVDRGAGGDIGDCCEKKQGGGAARSGKKLRTRQERIETKRHQRKTGRVCIQCGAPTEDTILPQYMHTADGQSRTARLADFAAAFRGGKRGYV